MTQKLHFFIGKGGVGKSTTSAVTAVSWAQEGKKTLLVSMDPAHNLGDIFQTDFSDRPRRVQEHLAVIEVDIDLWVKKCLKETAGTIKRNYSYETAFNLDKYFDVLQFSPGIEEYALLLAFENILQAFQGEDIIIFDMAPTALTLSFFSLPFVTLIWLESLLSIRKEIYAKKEIISKIRLGRKQLEQDNVKTKLESMIANYTRLRNRFVAESTRINLVINEDKLSFAEAFRIDAKLDKINIQVNNIIINKAAEKQIPAEIRRAFKDRRYLRYPMSSSSLMGPAAIKEYIHQNAGQLLGVDRNTRTFSYA